MLKVGGGGRWIPPEDAPEARPASVPRGAADGVSSGSRSSDPARPVSTPRAGRAAGRTSGERAMKARVLITGGGTGGHLYPALNLADALRALEPETEVLYVGSRRGLEARVLEGRDLPHRLVSAHPLHRHRPWRNVRTLAGAGPALWGAARAGRSLDPDVVVGTGGYAAGPALLWAWMTGRPIVVQEQNARPGLVTRWMAPRARQVHLGFPEAESALKPGPETEVFSFGNPVAVSRTGDVGGERAAADGGAGDGGRTTGLAGVCRAGRAEPSAGGFDWPGGRVVLVAGGSQGAAGLNRRLLTDLRQVKAWPTDLSLVWIAGRDHADELRAKAERLPFGDRVRVVSYIDDLGRQLSHVSLAISRAGAMFVSELAAAGVPAVLVPFPGAAAGHQRDNAAALADAGAAIVREESELGDGQLWQQASWVLNDEDRRRRMSEAARDRGAPDAARRIAEKVLELARGGTP